MAWREGGAFLYCLVPFIVITVCTLIGLRHFGSVTNTVQKMGCTNKELRQASILDGMSNWQCEHHVGWDGDEMLTPTYRAEGRGS